VIQRILNKIRIEPNGCWLWQGAKDGGGYGHVWLDGKTTPKVSRVLYEAYKGPIPKGYTIDHLCRNRTCGNPDHLEAVTMRENILRGIGPSANNARKTHCPSGHTLLGNNLTPRADGRRECRKCARESLRNWRNRNRQKLETIRKEQVT